MGNSAQAMICFGVLLPEDYEAPWEGEPYSGDWEEWWLLEICKWKEPFQLYDEHGGYFSNRAKKDSDLWYLAKSEFEKDHPCLVSIEVTSTYEAPQYIVAVLESMFRASWKNRRDWIPPRFEWALSR